MDSRRSRAARFESVQPVTGGRAPNPEVAGSNPAPRYSKSPGNGAFGSRDRERRAKLLPNFCLTGCDAGSSESTLAHASRRPRQPICCVECLFGPKSLPDAEKAQYLLDHQTISDRTWTNEPRLKGEKRDAFIRRILLG